MRDRSVARSIAVAVAIIAFVGVGSGAALAQTPIGPQQHFVGMVNGQEGSAVVYTVCPGPVTEHRTGPVRGGQTMAVAEAADGHGDTGLFSQILLVVPAGADRNQARDADLQAVRRTAGHSPIGAGAVQREGGSGVQFVPVPRAVCCRVHLGHAEGDVRGYRGHVFPGRHGPAPLRGGLRGAISTDSSYRSQLRSISSHLSPLSNTERTAWCADSPAAVTRTISLGIRPIGVCDRPDLGIRCTASDAHWCASLTYIARPCPAKIRPGDCRRAARLARDQLGGPCPRSGRFIVVYRTARKCISIRSAHHLHTVSIWSQRG